MSESSQVSYNDAILSADSAAHQLPQLQPPPPPTGPRIPPGNPTYLGRKSTKGIKLGHQGPRKPSVKTTHHKFKGNGRKTTTLAQRNASRRNIKRAQLARSARH